MLTVSFHQSPETLFPGTGRESDVGHGDAKGTVVNMPFAPVHRRRRRGGTAVETVLPAVGRRKFRPDLIVTPARLRPAPRGSTRPADADDGADVPSAARLCKELAEELCEGRWVATGGGGYQPYRVLPRAWAGRVARDDRGDRAARARSTSFVAPREWQHASDAPLTDTFLDPTLPRSSHGVGPLPRRAMRTCEGSTSCC